MISVMNPYLVLDRARDLGLAYLQDVATRHVGGTATQASLRAALGGPLPEGSDEPIRVIEHLAAAADPGIVATVGPRYFGFVTGGAVPVTVAADWLASVWDQNGALYVMSPAVAVIEDIVSAWLVELLHLPRGSSVGFVTGCHMANFTCLAAARHEVLRRAGWNVEAQGLQRAPRITVIAGGEVHISAMGALRLLGFGADEVILVPVDEQGRMRADRLEGALANVSGPLIVCAQAGNVSTGASDPIGRIADLVHAKGGWLHVDGAFGLWAAAVPELAPQVDGLARADSWATDAHKWLNVPYDSGLAIVADPAPHRAAMGLRASYLQRGDAEERIGMDWVPESSRRSRVIPLYALIRALGPDGHHRPGAPQLRAGQADGRATGPRRRRAHPERSRAEPGAGAVRRWRIERRRHHPRRHRAGAGRRHLLGRRRDVAGPPGDAHLGFELVHDGGRHRPVGRRHPALLPRGPVLIA